MNIDEIKKYNEQMHKRERRGTPIRRCYVFFQMRHVDYLLSENDRLTVELQKAKEDLEEAEEAIKAGVEQDCHTCVHYNCENVAECPYWPCNGEKWDYKKRK